MQQHRILFFFLTIFLFASVSACGANQTEPGATTDSPTTVATITEAAVAVVPTVTEESIAMEPTAVPPTLEPTSTSEPVLPPTNTPLPEATLAPTAVPLNVNGIPVDQIVVMSPTVREHVKAIFADGQTQGRSATTFSKLGDSTSMNPNFMGRFDDLANVNLGEYAYLQPSIDYYKGHFSRYGVSSRNGLHSWSVFDPLWADKEWCQANEDVLNCEFRLNNPSIIFVRLGSNDAGAPSGYRYNMKQVVETSIANGVIPVLVTKADRFEGDGNINNDILRELAAEFNVPLLEFDVVAETLPNRGLIPNDVHMAELVAPHDFTLPETMQSGHAIHDLVGLMMLDELRQELGQ